MTTALRMPRWLARLGPEGAKKWAALVAEEAARSAAPEPPAPTSAEASATELALSPLPALYDAAALALGDYAAALGDHTRAVCARDVAAAGVLHQRVRQAQDASVSALDAICTASPQDREAVLFELLSSVDVARLGELADSMRDWGSEDEDEDGDGGNAP